MPIIESFKKTLNFFNAIKKEGIIDDFALIGGLALSAWVRPRTTRDIDLVVAVSKRITWSDLVSIVETRLHKKVARFKATQRTVIQEKFSFVIGPIEVDIIGIGKFKLAEETVRNAVEAEVFGSEVKVATPEYLILLKLIPLSDQDAVDIRALLKKANIPHLRILAERHFLLPKLEPFLQKDH